MKGALSVMSGCIAAIVFVTEPAKAPADSPAALAPSLWWCTGVGTTNGSSFESQCFPGYGDCLEYRGQLMAHEALDISQCISQPRAWVVEMPGRRGAGGGALYEARQTKHECKTYRRALMGAPGARHLRISPCRVRRPSQVVGRNSATLRMQRAAAVAPAYLPSP